MIPPPPLLVAAGLPGTTPRDASPPPPKVLLSFAISSLIDDPRFLQGPLGLQHMIPPPSPSCCCRAPWDYNTRPLSLVKRTNTMRLAAIEGGLQHAYSHEVRTCACACIRACARMRVCVCACAFVCVMCKLALPMPFTCSMGSPSPPFTPEPFSPEPPSTLQELDGEAAASPGSALGSPRLPPVAMATPFATSRTPDEVHLLELAVRHNFLFINQELRTRLQVGARVLGDGCRGFVQRFRVPGFQGSRVPGFLGSRVSGFQGSWVPGFQGSWVPGFLGSWVPGFLGSWVPGFQGSRVSGFQGFRVLFINQELRTRLQVGATAAGCRVQGLGSGFRSGLQVFVRHVFQGFRVSSLCASGTPNP